jgi:hypothetical protein
MRLAALLIVIATLASPVRAQNAPATPQNAQAPVVTVSPAPIREGGAEAATSVTYQSVNPRLSYSVEPVDSHHVRLGGWESSGFTVDVDQNRTQISSNGEATSTTPRLHVDSIEIEVVGGRGYLTLTNPQP